MKKMVKWKTAILISVWRYIEGALRQDFFHSGNYYGYGYILRFYKSTASRDKMFRIYR